jgi:phospho-N-acetylmuramoyl-pentapeptide-transferase
MELFSIVKIIIIITVTFAFAIACTPLLTHFLYRYKLGKNIRDSKDAPLMASLHAHKSGTPTMGGILIWGSVLFVAVLFWVLSQVSSNEYLQHMNFLTRPQTLLPLGVMMAAAALGLLDDYLNVRKIGPKGGGLSITYRLISFTVIALIAAFWFYFKLDWDLVRIPFVGDFEIGLWYIPLALFVIIGTTFSINETDGLDGLAGGVVAVALTVLGAIAVAQGRFDLAALCGALVGALLAFLWFNVIPARFYMGDTGAMSLGVTVATIAMLTNSIFLLPVILFVPVIETLSVIIQLVSKKLRGKKVFRSAPIHHHFEAVGWPEAKIVMRFWIIAAVTASVGLVIALLDSVV